MKHKTFFSKLKISDTVNRHSIKYPKANLVSCYFKNWVDSKIKQKEELLPGFCGRMNKINVDGPQTSSKFRKSYNLYIDM